MTAERRLRLEARAAVMRSRESRRMDGAGLAAAVAEQLYYWRGLLTAVHRHIVILESMLPTVKRPAA